MESKLFSISKKKLIGLVFILYLTQVTNLFWSWHVCTDEFHHSESESPCHHDSKEGDDDDCFICHQLKILVAGPDVPDPGFFWSDIIYEEIFTPQFVCISELNKWPRLGRSPPAC